MAFLSRWIAVLAGAALAVALATPGCAGKAVNSAEVYHPVTGSIHMSVTVPTGESFVKVQYQANGQVVAESTDNANGFPVDVDSTTLTNDALVKIAAIGVRTDGSNRVLKQNYVLIPKPATDETPAPADSASPSASPGAKPSAKAS